MDVGDKVVVYATGIVTMKRFNEWKRCEEYEVTYYGVGGDILGTALVKEGVIEKGDIDGSENKEAV